MVVVSALVRALPKISQRRPARPLKEFLPSRKSVRDAVLQLRYDGWRTFNTNPWEICMKFTLAILAAICVAIPALAQAPAAGTPPAQHQPGTAAPAHPSSQETTKTAPADKGESSDKVSPAKEAAIRHLMEITQTSKLGDNIATYISGQVRS